MKINYSFHIGVLWAVAYLFLLKFFSEEIPVIILGLIVLMGIGVVFSLTHWNINEKFSKKK